jgi:dTDP-4-dehydrorhamnose reductase
MVLITGANGQLGQCFRQMALDWPQFDFFFADSATLNLTDSTAVSAFFRQHRLSWCINCAAYTAVDKAESEPEQAKAVNTTAVAFLARQCARNGVPLVHISTDYVYHSDRGVPLVETDKTSPKGVYAATKLGGDRAVLRYHPDGGMVIRTSWVYARHGHNFVNTMLRLGAERPVLRVVFDQVGTPTYAPDLAAAILQIVQQVEQKQVPLSAIAGIWHYSNEGVTSWYDFAKAIFDLKNMKVQVEPIESAQFPTPARRPHFSVLNKNKVKSVFQLNIPHWRESLTTCLCENLSS